MSFEEESHVNEMADKALNSMLSVCSECKNTDVMERILTMNVVGAVAILRGLKGDKFIEVFLNSAIKDTSNKISVKRV